jgi:hypothetical protein
MKGGSTVDDGARERTPCWPLEVSPTSPNKDQLNLIGSVQSCLRSHEARQSATWEKGRWVIAG